MNPLLILFVLGWIAGVDPVSFSGRVTNESGLPLAGVRVSSLPWDETTSDKEGRFVLHLQPPRSEDWSATFVRFSLAGYSPRTVTVSQLTQTIELATAPEPEWRPPICDRTEKLSTAIGKMRFVVPRGARARRISDDDYTAVNLRFHGGWIVHGAGPNWSWGVPTHDLWLGVARVKERDVVAPWGTSPSIVACREMVSTGASSAGWARQ